MFFQLALTIRTPHYTYSLLTFCSSSSILLHLPVVLAKIYAVIHIVNFRPSHFGLRPTAQSSPSPSSPKTTIGNVQSLSVFSGTEFGVAGASKAKL